jgi:hypothetical protein
MGHLSKNGRRISGRGKKNRAAEEVAIVTKSSTLLGSIIMKEDTVE